MNSLIILASGASLNSKINKFKELALSYDIMSYGGSLLFCYDKLNICPKYFTYIDPSCTFNSLDRLLKLKNKQDCTLFLADPIVTNNRYTNWRYIGNPSGGERIWEIEYPKYIKKLERISRFVNLTKIPSTSLAVIHNLPYDKFVKSFPKFFPRTKVRDILEEQTAKGVFCVMSIWTVGRLTTYILPLMYYLLRHDYLKYDTLLLGGFDGNNTRFCQKNFPRKRDKELAKIWEKEYRYYMPMWKELFSSIGVEIFKITPSDGMRCIESIDV